MPGTVNQKASLRYLQKTNVGFVKKKKVCYFFNFPLDKSHFITEVRYGRKRKEQSYRSDGAKSAA